MERQSSLPSKRGLKLGATGDQVERLQHVLSDLGYLRLPNDPGVEDSPRATAAVAETIGTFDEGTAQGLARFQELHDLEVTGQLDRLTLQSIERMPCRTAAFRFPEQEKHTYTYAILNEHPDISTTGLSRAIEQAFALWALHIPLSFVPTWADGSPDITFRFESLGGELGNALIEFNKNLNWRVGSGGGNSYDLISIAAHEIGHRLGLSHTIPAVAGSVMNEALENRTAFRAVSSLDRQRVQAIHGSQSVRDTTMVHGNSAVLETSDSVVSFRPMGPYTRVTGVAGLGTSWFHFSPSTPAWRSESENPQSRLHAVWLNLRTYGESEISRVHVWDGKRFMGEHWLQLGGGLTGGGPLDWYLRLGVARKPRLDTTGGVGISVDVRWDFGTDAARRVDFVSAGADFIEYRQPFGVVGLDVFDLAPHEF